MTDKVTALHPEYEKYKAMWQKCRDAVEGQDAIKIRRTDYLPIPTGQDKAQYDRYLQRAQYYNAVQRIKNSIIGQIYRKKPIITPAELDLSDVSNTGLDINQFAKEILAEVVEVGRVGTLIDYGNDKPILIKVLAESITNWKYQYINGVQVTTLVVIKEAVLNEENIFAHEFVEQYRVLSLKEGRYVQNIWKKAKSSNSDFEEGEDIVPLIDGQPFTFIPFLVLGSKGISLDITKPIIKDIVDINIGHYVNSADYENDLHWSGVKTPCFPGWKVEDGPIPIGKPMGTPTGSTPFMLESSSQSGLKEEMTRKEERMATLGSQIIAQQGRYLQSAETSNNQQMGESSILASLSDNLDSYFNDLLFIYLAWAGQLTDDYSITFNKDFDPGEVNMDSIVKLSALNDNGKISYATFYNYLKKNEIVPKEKTPEMEFEELSEEDALINGRNI